MDYRSNQALFDDFSDKYREVVRNSQTFLSRKPDRFCVGKAKELIRLASKHLGDPKGSVAVDLGCGVGLSHEFLHDKFKSLHGIDLSGDSIATAKRHNPSVNYLTYDGGTLPYADNFFDLAFTVCVLHHVAPTDRPGFLLEMARIVRPGGLVAVFEHNPWNPLTRLAVGRCEFDEDAVLLSRARVDKLLRGVALIPVCSHYLFFDPFGLPLMTKLERHLSSLPLGAQFVTVARKPFNRHDESRAHSKS